MQSFSFSSLEHLGDEDEDTTPGLGVVHQAVLDNNPEKLEKLIEVSALQNIAAYFGQFFKPQGKLPHSAPSWILSLAKNLASSNSQDGATKWHYNCKEPSIQPSIQPASQPSPAYLSIHCIYDMCCVPHLIRF